MNSVKITPRNLYGEIKIQPSKSLCHRAIIAASLSKGISNIKNVTFSHDIKATIDGMKALGADIKRSENNLCINGSEFLNLNKNEINCIESGSTLRFLIPIALLTGNQITFNGEGMLKNRPLNPYYEIFKKQNINYSSHNGLPLSVKGLITPGDFEIEGNISSQFITGLMFALPLLKGDSRIILTTKLESKGYVDLTIDTLDKFSVKIESNNYNEFYIKGNQKYMPTDYKVEGDFSQSAFWLVAGILGGKIQCTDININSLQGDKAIVDIIKKMGGNISVYKDKIVTETSKTKGITIDASDCPDIVPILSVLAALSEGTTEIINAERLRIKESDRLKAMCTELNKLGADVKETNQGLIINGKDKLKGGTVESWNDHRIAMALSIASIKCSEPVIIKNSHSVKKSYPEFFKDFSMLGGVVHEWSLGK
ncbi:3-phosphoshikimate 1-carboxyvinyltransferase [Clostridium acetireducens DSM 10703]|uniref:3-phosphoshikimate 1-carboxyvinyltransferase n=1 Tax=Clostridium acetireducens DSM 10703 TaxID=1121290 RepID=A0A1E8EYK3_9CLOT|nr:3-phosphoshikimate 1-carboxyvinyltransferase [Clostridium acetireducens]OFI06078.1 3-phosphoshikimate 1-carboxyvinyltransferase [Clostridium acetireducens DSM 10703]